MMDLNFFNGKKVFITGHTGFKGSWLCRILVNAGAQVTGYSLLPPTSPHLFGLCSIEKDIHSVVGDIRDIEKLRNSIDSARPEIVIHLAAQPIVRESYSNPVYTYETNVMGTVNLCECVRENPTVRSFLNVTTDKVYSNREWEWGYRENDILDGSDPYSNSKSCSELVTHSYKSSFFDKSNVAVSTARAGNVIGGGDFAADRIIPDCIRAAEKKEEIIVRNPGSVRPYQHVLEPLFFYLRIIQAQFNDKKYEGYYNVGPEDENCISTGELVEIFCQKWGDEQKWRILIKENQPKEANFLKLDCSRAKSVFYWKPCWNIETAVDKTIEWTRCYLNHDNIGDCMVEQIEEYLLLQSEQNEL